MHKYRLAVCEDDEVVRDEICRVCDETLAENKISHEITPFADAEELERFLENEGQVFDLLVLDIKLKNKTGMELARELRSREDRVSILFITGYVEYAVAGYEVQPVQFLLKPLNWEALKRAVLTDWKLNHRPKTVFLEKGRRKVRLDVNDILYVEPDGSHGVQIILESGSRKLVVMSVAFRTAEPADHKILFHAAFLLPDT